MGKFQHLHVHDHYSALDGYGTASQYCEHAKELGFEYLALTNHGNVDGVLRWQEACDEHGIKNITGCEAYIVPDLTVKQKGERRHHITLLAKSQKGFQGIMRMLSKANLDGFYYKPRIDPQLLIDNIQDIAVGTACLNSFLLMEGGTNLVHELKRRTDVFVEIMPHAMQEQRDFNLYCADFAKKLKLPLVATNDCHYAKQGDAKYQEVLLAMQRKVKWEDANRWKFDVDTMWLATSAEMTDLFAKQGVIDDKTVKAALSASYEIAQSCHFHIEQVPVVLPRPIIPGYEQLNEDDQLIELTFDGYRDRIRKHEWINEDNREEYTNRLMEELEIIISLGFSRYFLIVFELINWCKENDIMVGPGRGSVGGSLLAFCLGITQVDPIKQRLVFTRFISEARIDLPDIDMDFEDIKRDQIMQHLKDLYGEYNVVGLSTFSTLRGKGALRDVARVFDVPIADVSKAAECVVTRSLGDARSDFSIADAFDAFEDGIAFKRKYPQVSEIAMAMEGQIKGHGKHAAAMCVSATDLREGLNANYANRSQSIVVNWDKVDAEYMGLMKLDVLGLNALTILSKARQLIRERKGVEIDYDTLPMDDSAVYNEFNTGGGVGVFQFNSPGMMRICREVGVEDFESLITMNALHRPGCLRSGMVPTFRKRKHGEEPVTYVHPFIEGITKETQGLILYQEQVMRLMYELGGLPWKTSDMIRKVISKRKGEEQFMKFKQLFIDGCVEHNTVTAEEAEKIFDELQYFGSYGFNRAHACEYALIAYWQMWLKIHHPVEYMIAILSWGNEQKKADHIDEVRRLGLKILLPDINMSEADTWQADDEGNLLIPFTEIKGLGPAAAKPIVAERSKNGPYKSFDDFAERVPKRQVNKKIKELLIQSLAFEPTDAKLELSEAKLDELSALYDFSLSNDPMYKYRKMMRRIGESIPIEPLSNVILGGKAKSVARYHFGVMDVLKFGFKERGDGKTLKDVRGTAGDLGGVYGNFKDESDYIMLVFSQKFYRERKYEIEHCEGRWMLARAQNTGSDNNIWSDGVWFGDDLLAGNVQGLDLELARPVKYTKDWLKTGAISLSECSACDLRRECSKPVSPTLGSFNFMIIGEAPGKKEDEQGKGFVGDAGDVLWTGRDGVSGLIDYGFERSWFHVTNVCKCWPSKTKTPKRKHINACSAWIKREIEVVKPAVILAFGNTGLKYFRDQESGIMELSGTCEWIDEVNAWVVYGMHPAATLYSPENSEHVNRGLQKFAEVVASIGFGVAA